MKKTSKALILCLSAVLLVTTSVLGTMAYLTSQDIVVNTFTVGKVSITLDELKVNPDGTPNGTDRVRENVYKLLPGHSYTKDPIVHVGAGSEDCYIFVKVENGITAIEADKKVADQITEKGWVAVQGAETDGDVYVYSNNRADPATVTGGTDIPVFDKFTIAGAVDNYKLAIYADKTIVVTAYAIQADGFEGKTAGDIWNAGFDVL